MRTQAECRRCSDMDSVIVGLKLVQYDNGLAVLSCICLGFLPQGTVVLDNLAGISDAENAVILTKLPKN